MADISVEKKVKKVVVFSEVDEEVKADFVGYSATKIGAADVAAASADATASKENGSSDDAACVLEKAAGEEIVETDEGVADVTEEPVVAAAENGVEKEAAAVEETDGVSTDSSTTVKRQVLAEITTDGKSDGVATPQKKPKLEEISKEESQNGSEPTEEAA